MKAPILRAFFSSLAVFLAVPALALAGSSTKPKVLVIHFALEVNPVTSSYLDHQLHRAQDGHYNAAVIEIDTPTLPTLNPIACAPITARVTPPYLPSKIWPYLSIKKL